MQPGPSGPGPPRVWKKSRKSPEKVWKKGPEKTLSRLFPDSRGARGRKALGDTFFLRYFSDFFGGLSARETVVNGQRVPNVFVWESWQ